MAEQKHPLNVENYAGTLEQLAQDVKNMRYDKVSEFLGYLAAQCKEEADNDSAQGRAKLSSKLYSASAYLSHAQREIDSAWSISKPYMKNDEKAE